MHSVNLIIFTVLASTLNFCYGANKEDFDMQKMMEELGEEGNKLRDECFAEFSMTLTDLHSYEKAEDISENELCFYKCFFEKSYLLDKDGKVILASVEALEEMEALEKSERENLINCIKEVKPVQTCKDLVSFEKCFDEVFA